MATEYINEQTRISYVDVPAILGGTMVALAISLILAHFGATLGLAASYEVERTGTTAIVAIMVSGLYMLWVQVMASMAGGYLAGRMRRPVAGASAHERDIRDGAHGLIVWATGTVAVTIAVALVAAFAALVPEIDITPVVPETERTQDMIDTERNTAIILAFITASVSLVSGVVSWWAATKGGDHRDNAVDHSHYVKFR